MLGMCPTTRTSGAFPGVISKQACFCQSGTGKAAPDKTEAKANHRNLISRHSTSIQAGAPCACGRRSLLS